MPASTSSWQSRSYSSAEPSHQWTESGLVSAAISSTHATSFSFLVGISVAAAVSLTVEVSSLSDRGCRKTGDGAVDPAPRAVVGATFCRIAAQIRRRRPPDGAVAGTGAAAELRFRIRRAKRPAVTNMKPE